MILLDIGLGLLSLFALVSFFSQFFEGKQKQLPRDSYVMQTTCHNCGQTGFVWTNDNK